MILKSMMMSSKSVQTKCKESQNESHPKAQIRFLKKEKYSHLIQREIKAKLFNNRINKTIKSVDKTISKTHKENSFLDKEVTLLFH